MFSQGKIIYLHFVVLFLFGLQASLLLTWSAHGIHIILLALLQDRQWHIFCMILLWFQYFFFFFIILTWGWRCLEAIELIVSIIHFTHIVLSKVSNHLIQWFFLLLVHFFVDIFLDVCVFHFIFIFEKQLLRHERYIWEVIRYHVHVLCNLSCWGLTTSKHIINCCKESFLDACISTHITWMFKLFVII